MRAEAVNLADNIDVETYWMPFTSNRDFKQRPRILRSAQGHHYTTLNGDRVYDFFSGLWTAAGHCHPKIVEAVQSQVQQLDHGMGFQVGCDRSFELAERLTEMAPARSPPSSPTRDRVRRHRAEDRARLHRVRGEGQRTRLIGRERGFTGSTSAACPSAALSPTGRCSAATSCPAWITCGQPSTSTTRRSRGVSPPGVSISQTISSASRSFAGPIRSPP